MTIWNDFVNLLYPHLCKACGESLHQNEVCVCSHCRYELPQTHFHDDHENPINKLFWGRVPIEAATAYYFFHKAGLTQELIHNFKYHGFQDVGRYVGNRLGEELQKSESFRSVEHIVPVPLHPKKLKQRGFNQSQVFGEGIAEILHIPCETSLLHRQEFTETQTRKGRYQRWENVAEVFGVGNPERLQGKHILLVDDVLTTGATIEACAQTLLHQVPDIKLYVATMAYASY